MKAKKKEGFTIIELMVSMIAFSILALAVGSMLYYGWLGWRRSSDSIAMQRDAMIAMRIVEHRIRNASLDGSSPLALSWSASELTFASEDNFSSSEVVLDAGVVLDSFNVESDGTGGVVVEFVLSTANGTDGNSYEMTVYPRN